MSFTRDVLAALAIIVAAILAVTVYARLRPRFLLRIVDDWIGDRLVLQFEIENNSAVVALVDAAYVEVKDGHPAANGQLGNWLTFTTADETEIFRNTNGPADPNGRSKSRLRAWWRERRARRKQTDKIFPGEVLSVGRIYDRPDDDAVMQVGLQVKLRKKWLGLFPEHQQTTTRYVVKPRPGSDAAS